MSYEKIPAKPENWTNDRLHFYKYLTAETAKIVLTNRTLRWSAPALFNDPFDVQFNMHITADPAAVRPLAMNRILDVIEGRIEPDQNNPAGQLFKMLRDPRVKMSRQEIVDQLGPAFDEGFSKMVEILPSVNSEAAKHLEDIKILCLTVRPDNNLMWSHYADSHRGVVLRFRSIPALDTPYGLAKPINYVHAVPPLVSEQELADIFAGAGTFEKAGIVDRAIYTKSSEWAYEEEWRLSSGGGRRPGELFEDVPFGWNELDGLIFGLRTSDENRDALGTLARQYPNVQIFAATREEGKLGVLVN